MRTSHTSPTNDLQSQAQAGPRRAVYVQLRVKRNRGRPAPAGSNFNLSVKAYGAGGDWRATGLVGADDPPPPHPTPPHPTPPHQRRCACAEVRCRDVGVLVTVPDGQRPATLPDGAMWWLLTAFPRPCDSRPAPPWRKALGLPDADPRPAWHSEHVPRPPPERPGAADARVLDGEAEGDEGTRVMDVQGYGAGHTGGSCG
ncbi:hypothetical protein SKAU_G00365780 [Synaphobranchus kaupii]|uniref:Uncharacterized protein n=1 Tax=Synaphobranchus kaupii TaxID=118154 RepID=A0A9Q1EF28_SYNKA|nr:hypothetical protein SKAU_G00365780 [Synaphobranchus kaupii]